MQYRTFANVAMVMTALTIGLLFPISGHSRALPCQVVVGPTSDTELTEANLSWTRQVADQVTRLVADDTMECKVLFVDAWARANKMFSDGSADVLFPEIVDDPTQPGITGLAVALTHGFVVFNHFHEPKIDNIHELVGRSVGLIRGRFYPVALTSTNMIDFQYANSLSQNFNKLVYNRIDATVEYRLDGLRQLDQMGLTNKIQHGAEFGVEQLAYRFQDTAEGRQLRLLFDTAIQELRANGTYTATFNGTSQRQIP